MKRYAPIVLLLSSLAAAYGVFAANELSVTTQMQRCFQAHAALMDKPTRYNVVACWRAHHHLMDRR